MNDSLPIPILCLLTVALFFPDIAHAQGGPPFFTNDPGTPGNANWEINIGSMQTIERGISSYQVPQLDVNFGAGERIQLTCEIPYIVQSVKGQPLQTGWSNALAGVKWRFLDRGEGNWRLSTFPQIETGGSLQKREKGIAGEGPRFYLPLELTKRVGPLDMNLEAGYFFPARGPAERTLGFAAGRTVSPKLELDGEVYDIE